MKFISMLIVGVFLTTTVNASWVIVNSDGSSEKLASCCSKKPVKKRVKVRTPEICVTCDYSAFKEAKLLPVGDQKLAPAKLGDCGK